MPTIIINLKDIIIDPDSTGDLAALPAGDAIDRIKQSYGFLASSVDVAITGGTAVISLNEPPAQKVTDTEKTYNRGVRDAEQGDYAKAIKRFEQVLAILPLHVEARRNLAMAYFELKDFAQAKKHLLECSMIAPNDVWTLILLGNLYGKYERNFPVAEFYYEKGSLINPNDAILLNNYAALKMELKDYSSAKALFEKAIAANPAYPNTYLGLAMLYREIHDTDAAQGVLDRLFDQSKSSDIRAVPIYKYARDLYLDFNTQLAEKQYKEMMDCISSQKNEVELQTGLPVQIVEDNTLEYISGISQMAWKHNRQEHVIRYRSRAAGMTPHLLAHELEHIVLEQKARKAGRNKFFTTNAATREHSLRSIGDHILKLKKQGYTDDEIAPVMPELVSGLCTQLLNCPLDMIVEYNLYEKYPTIRSSQLASLQQFHLESMHVFNSQDIKRFTPPFMYRASITLNCATAFFVDQLFKDRTDYASAYKSSEVFQTGRQLFDIWKNRNSDFHPGDEYDVVDEYAKFLKLQKWYAWQADTSFEQELPTDTETRQEPFKASINDAYGFCIDALRRFDGKPHDEILRIASEIGLLGEHGIDYKNPTTLYTLKSIPHEQFCGLHLMCLMFVGFKITRPDMATGLDFNDAYQLALEAQKASVH